MADGQTQSNHYGALIIFSGPSGAGKSTICRILFERMPRLHFSVSCTTRAPRPGERDGVDYHFLTVEEFRKRIDEGAFLEWAEVHGNYYGTPVKEVQEAIRNGEDIILDIDVQGHEKILGVITDYPELVSSCASIFLVPPSRTILEQRLRGRGTDSLEAIEKRLKNAIGEMKRWEEYDYVVMNDVAEKAADSVQAVIESVHVRVGTQKGEPWNE